MTTIATAVGYIVIGMAVLLALAIAAGKFFDRKQDYKIEFEPDDRDLSKRPPFGGYTDPDTLHEPSRYVPPRFRQFDDNALSDTPPADLAP